MHDFDTCQPGMYHMAELSESDIWEQLHNYACGEGKSLREIYLRHYRRVIGDPFAGVNPIPRWDDPDPDHNIWEKLVVFLILNHFDPEIFMACQFKIRNREQTYPEKLRSKVAIEKYKAYSDETPEQLQASLTGYVSQLRVELAANELYTMLTNRQRTINAICSSSIQAPPLFRYAMALQENLAGVMKTYEAAAFEQYLFRWPKYDEAWPGLIPKHFQELARFTYDLLMKRNGIPPMPVR